MMFSEQVRRSRRRANALRRRRVRRLSEFLFACLFFAALAAILVSPRPALAADNNVHVASVSVQRLDATVTKTTIVAAYATAHDIVEVYNYVPVQVSTDWRQATSMDSATWVFRRGGSTPKLVIVFSTEAGVHVARLYDDQFATGGVAITLKHNRPVLSLATRWTLKAETKQPWILPDGRPATDLEMQSAFSLPHEDDAQRGLTHRWRGADAWDFRMVDPGNTGVPRYTLLQLHPQSASPSVPRTLLDVNVAGYRVTPFRNSVFWPYLGSASVGVRSWFDHQPPLSMDWASGQLQNFGSVIPDLEPEEGMQIYSDTTIHAHQTNDLNFENPFAYYRFDPGHTGFPNLIIRNYYFPRGDKGLQPGGTAEPVEDVRYSWGDGNGLIQFKLGLLGRFAANSSLQVNGRAIRTMDYQTLPSWVVNRRWDMETLVASENGGYRSSEGIYEWDYTGGDFSWALGDAASLPVQVYRTISAGIRGEYRVLPTTPPQLYINAVDGRLHLLGAQQGVWSVDLHQTIYTASLNGQTADHWSRSADGVPVESLYALPGALLYADREAVTIQPYQTLRAIVLFAPPTDEGTLNALRGLLPAYPPAIAQKGLRAMLGASAAGQLTLTGATLAHVRLEAGGWRAELSAGAGELEVAGSDVPPTLLGPLLSALGCVLPEGATSDNPLLCPQATARQQYVLRYDGAWSVQAATPPDLRVLAVQAGGARPSLDEMPIAISVVNGGMSDSTGHALLVWAQRPDEPRVVLGRYMVSVPAGERRTFSMQWLPTGPGQWTVGAAIEAPDTAGGPVLAVVTIPAPAAPPWWTLGPVGSRRLVGGALALLATLAVLTALTAGAILR